MVERKSIKIDKLKLDEYSSRNAEWIGDLKDNSYFK